MKSEDSLLEIQQHRLLQGLGGMVALAVLPRLIAGSVPIVITLRSDEQILCIGIRTWITFDMVSHPAVTCIIPVTSQAAHMEENTGAAFGRLLDHVQRRRMENCLAAL